jgi:hypothetical protein
MSQQVFPFINWLYDIFKNPRVVYSACMFGREVANPVREPTIHICGDYTNCPLLLSSSPANWSNRKQNPTQTVHDAQKFVCQWPTCQLGV